MNASMQTLVTTPFVGYERCIVFCQLVHHAAGLNTDVIFILKPCTEKGIPVENSPLLLVGSSPTESKLTMLSVEQAGLALDMLSDLVKEWGDKDDDEILNLDTLNEARRTLCDIKKVEPLVNLCDRLSVILSPDVAPINQWDLQIELSGVCMVPINFEFIGFKASKDIIKVTFQLENIPKDDVKLLRLLDDVFIYIGLENKKELEYTGVCSKLEVHNGLLVMTIEPFIHDLDNTRTGHLSAVGISPLDLVHLIGRRGGLDEQNLIIEGFSPSDKAYTITVPIINMKLIEPFGFGNVTFNPAGYSPLEISRINNVSKESSTIFDTHSLAVVHVQAQTLFDALKVGINQIEQALDVVLHIIRADTVFKGAETDSMFGSWKFDDLTPVPVVSTWIHIEEPFGGGQIIMDTTRIEQPSELTVENDIHDVLQQMDWYESLMRVMEETDDKGLKSLFNALKWLRRSWEAKDSEDKIIFANIALEFVASGEPSPPVIPKEFIKRVKNAAVDKFSELYQGEEKGKYITTLNQKFADAMNNAPLRIQIEGLVDRISIPVSDVEMALVFEGRKIRNDLVHGRGANQTFNKTKNRKMVNTIGILATHKLRSFYKEGCE